MQHRAILAALLDYRQFPGKYSLISKQPALLFASITEVLQLASGRSPLGLKAGGPSAAVQEAASFFIRTAMLYRGADHYALLGLPRDADAAAVKDRYRLMMRLMHPDFSGSPLGDEWPADAATRVNQAYEVLSSPVQRRNYDEQLDCASPRETTTEARPVRSIKPAPPPSPHGNSHQHLKWLAAGFGAAGSLALAAFLWAGLAGENEMLVQRAAAPRKTIAARADPMDTISKWFLPPAAVPRTDAADKSAKAAYPSASAVVRQPAVALKPSSSDAVESMAGPSTSAESALASVPPAVALPSPASLELPAQVVAVPTAPPSPPTLARSAAQSRPASVAIARATPFAEPPRFPNTLTLAEVHPLLSKMLEHMENGWGDRVINLLERDARGGAAAQAWLQDYNAVIDGGRPVKLSHVQLKAEPRDGRLLVTGQVLMEMRNQPAGTPAKPFSVRAEFASRDGTVVLTGLARAQDN